MFEHFIVEIYVHSIWKFYIAIFLRDFFFIFHFTAFFACFWFKKNDTDGKQIQKFKPNYFKSFQLIWQTKFHWGWCGGIPHIFCVHLCRISCRIKKNAISFQLVYSRQQNSYRANSVFFGNVLWSLKPVFQYRSDRVNVTTFNEY